MNVFACLGKVLDSVADGAVAVSNGAASLSKLAEVGYLKANAYLEQTKKQDLVNQRKADLDFANEAAECLKKAKDIRRKRCTTFTSQEEVSWEEVYAEIDALYAPKPKDEK